MREETASRRNSSVQKQSGLVPSTYHLARFSLFLWSCIVMSGCASTAMQSKLSLEEELDTLVPKMLMEGNVAGAAIAVIQRGHVTWAKGYGFADKNGKVPMKPDTRFSPTVIRVQRSWLRSSVHLFREPLLTCRHSVQQSGGDHRISKGWKFDGAWPVVFAAAMAPCRHHSADFGAALLDLRISLTAGAVLLRFRCDRSFLCLDRLDLRLYARHVDG